MSKQDQIATLILDRKENLPKKDSIITATVLARNSSGLYLDINKTFEGQISNNELGDKKAQEYSVGDQIEAYVLGEDKNLIKLSIKQIESQQKWTELEALQNQNIEVEIVKIVKSGVEAKISTTNQVGFIPNGYIDNQFPNLRNKKPEEWLGEKIPVKIHELEKSKNKIILNNKVVSQEIKEAKSKEVMNSISIGQNMEVEIIRLADFGVFVDLGGMDALIPASELSWQRFNKPSDVYKIGDRVTAQVFKIDQDNQKIALSVKKVSQDPWSTLSPEMTIGYQQEAKVITHADFGVFVEILPGVEALLHKSNYQEAPELGSMLKVEIKNLEIDKKRMGVILVNDSTDTNAEENTTEDEVGDQTATEELEHVG